MTARQDGIRTNAGATRVKASRRSWTPPTVREIATSAAELTMAVGTDTLTNPS